MSIVTRFAPSPTGWLHLGHVHAARFAHGRARAGGGRFLVRLEDIDAGRCRPDYADGILEDLAWLGLAGDGAVRVQSRHSAEYRAALDGLAARGLLYPCFCSRAEVAAAQAAPHTPPEIYPGTCRHLPRDEAVLRIAGGSAYALRLDLARARAALGRGLEFHDEAVGWVKAVPERLGDVVLARRDVPASYHLCVVHDDALQGVTLVTRAEDLREATHLHVLLQALLGLPTPDYAFHPLLRDADGRRLAKRDRAATVRAMRVAGLSPADVLAAAA